MQVAKRLADVRDRFGDRAFLVDAAHHGDVWSFGRVAEFAAALDAAINAVADSQPVSVEHGEPVALSVTKPGMYAAAYAALLAAGRVILPLAPNAPASETAKVMAAAGARLVVTDAGEPGSADVPLGDGLVVRRLPTGAPPAHALDARAGGGVLMFTSGTTGAPKGVALCTAQLWHNAESVAAAHGFGVDDVGLCPLPLWHINAQVVGVLAALVAGATLVVDQGFHRRTFWSLADRYGATWANGAPAIIHVLGTDEARGEAPESMRFVRSASAPLSVAARERFERRFGVPVVESYGMTEAAGMITVNSLERPRKPGSAGRPAGVNLRVRDDEGAAVGAGEPGRVEISGPSVIGGYVGGAESQRFTADGWLDTGDVGYLDHDGDLFLLGRADDVINRGGEMVHPREVEEVLLRHPAVRCAAVVGVPDEKLGERVVALVVSHAEAPASGLEAQLSAMCREELSAYKCPSDVRLVGELPIGGTGKVRHRQARGLALADASLADAPLAGA